MDDTKAVAVVSGFPPDTNLQAISRYFEGRLAIDHQYGIDVIYPVCECSGLRDVDPNKPVAILMSPDKQAIDQLLTMEFRDLKAEPMHDQVFSTVTATIDDHFWRHSLRQETVFKGELLAGLQESFYVKVKCESSGDITITGLSFQIELAQRRLEGFCKGRDRGTRPTKADNLVANDSGQPSSARKDEALIRNREDPDSSSHAATANPSASGSQQYMYGSKEGEEVSRHSHGGEQQEMGNGLTKDTNSGHSLRVDLVQRRPDGPDRRRNPYGGPDTTTSLSYDTATSDWYSEHHSHRPGSPRSDETQIPSKEQQDLPTHSLQMDLVQRRPDGSDKRRDPYGGRDTTTSISDDTDASDSYCEDDWDYKHRSHRPPGSTSTDETDTPSWEGHDLPRNIAEKEAANSSPHHVHRHHFSNDMGAMGQAASSALPNDKQREGRHPAHSYSDVVRPKQQAAIAGRLYQSRSSNITIRVYEEDITKTRVDAIVNSSDPKLSMAGGVGRAILKAGGYAVGHECSKKSKRTLKETEAEMTTGGNLCKKIIHAILTKPFDRRDYRRAKSELSVTFSNCLRAAERSKMSSIAIPAIGAGRLGYPRELVCESLYAAVSGFCYENASGSLKSIHLVDLDRRQTQLTNDRFQNANNYRCVVYPGSHAWQVHSNDGPSLPGSSDVAGAGGPGNKRSATSSGHRGPCHSADKGTSEKDECPICLEVLGARNIKTLKCGHTFCEECIGKSLKMKNACPVCGSILGKLTGNQPTNGKMLTCENKYRSLQGYGRHGVLEIEYYFPGGVQTDEHPNPGKMYKGATRKAYLPNNKEGRDVLSLLRKAFDARLTFTIGQSVTTGLGDRVTWNDIHHKTSLVAGGSFGYPDPTYLDRVKEELAAKGIK